ncbi:MAG: L,D-transpeptidase [Chthoniobacterales bacterium]
MFKLPEDSDPDQSAISAEPVACKVIISVPEQSLRLMRGDSVEAEYPVSTSRFGLGSEPGSYKTPLGRFRVFEKFGDGAPLGAVFKERQQTGEVVGQGGDEDRILTRILWLEGCDPDNANTRDRYIYLHGTNQEIAIGTPASHGCVRLRSQDLVDLYDRVPPGTSVEIVG